MRLLIVAPEQIPIPPLLGGSVEICILGIARELAVQHDVTIISRQHRRYPRRTVEGRLTIIRVPTGPDGRYLRGVKRELKKHTFDLIQVDNRPRFVVPIKRLFPDIPVSLFMHSLTYVSKPYAKPQAAESGLRRADVIVANSTSLQSELARRFPAIQNHIRMVWLGVDTTRFRPVEIAARMEERRRYGLRSAFTVLFTGRLIPRKGIPVLMRAVRQASRQTRRPIQLVIAGGAQRAAYGAALRKLAKKLRLTVRFLGTVPHARIHRVYRLADCFVCPSQGHEAFGLVNVEAMASGIPVIAANNGGIKEVIQDGTSGLLVKSYRSSHEYAAAIASLMQSPEIARELAEQGRLAALERFGWSETAAKLTEVYGGLIAVKEERWMSWASETTEDISQANG
ncbi:glycosyltransferase family 4 protein [Paenibacillus cremeus]|uniref:Glycosyltransferase family 4 protein n=1 Tax=Paenibacillus cremeus TaxID=2163881 RepID=A0A559K082_9BACL|nr:glycosyltransferase family 4 protein [Paenibacillus cremeus]TVY05559.1 glycosyltransferase family 4 protein [Paenibacillus cremeus]